MSIPAPRSSAASIIRISRSTRRRPALPRRWKACSRRTRFPGGRRPRPRTTTIWPGPRRRRRSPAASTSARSWCGSAQNLPEDAFITTGAGNFSAWVHRFYRFRKFATHIGPMLRLDGLRRAVGARHQARISRAHRGVLLRRRRLPDERPGVRHRRAVRPADHHRDRRQRHLRHHPHAPGARVSDPRGRHRTAAIRISPPTPRRSAASA